jgi:hypothetical protein
MGLLCRSQDESLIELLTSFYVFGKWPNNRLFEQVTEVLRRAQLFINRMRSSSPIGLPLKSGLAALILKRG